MSALPLFFPCLLPLTVALACAVLCVLVMVMVRATHFQGVIGERLANVGLGGNLGALYKESQHCFKLFASGGALRCKGFLATLEVCPCLRACMCVWVCGRV